MRLPSDIMDVEETLVQWRVEEDAVRARLRTGSPFENLVRA